MRFSTTTVAASAVLVGFTMALPNKVVYETETPYAPYAVSTTADSYPTTTPCESSTSVKHVPYPTTTADPVPYPTTTPCDESTTVEPVPYPTTTPCDTDTPTHVDSTYETTTPCDTDIPTHVYSTYETTTPCETNTPTYVDSVPEPTTPCETTTGYPTYPTHYPNATTTYQPTHEKPTDYPTCPGGEHCLPSHTTYAPVAPECSAGSGYNCPPPAQYPTGTGVPYPPVNTSSPYTVSPPPSEGAASRMGVSMAAVAGVALLAFLA